MLLVRSRKKLHPCLNLIGWINFLLSVLIKWIRQATQHECNEDIVFHKTYISIHHCKHGVKIRGTARKRSFDKLGTKIFPYDSGDTWIKTLF